MHILITGHTGFKGAWLTALLHQLGHEVSGISLPAVEDGAFLSANLEGLLKSHKICDVREKAELNIAIRGVNPDAVIHMAAQPLVLESYSDPAGTIETNVFGTLNVLESCREVSGVKAVLVVTTDKVYKDNHSGNYSEDDALGGFDPYSASKAMADILSQSYGNLGLNYAIGIARAGNVIGLGDVSENRLIPDITRAFVQGEALSLRNLGAVRPWQHVLDCVYGYVLALQKLVHGHNSGPGALVLNFGPEPSGYKTVAEVVTQARRELGSLEVDTVSSELKETSFLTLNSSKARHMLEWRDRLNFESAIEWSLESIDSGLDRDLMMRQISRYLAL
jgi:CDP-glucose 4,6-dehydratase